MNEKIMVYVPLDEYREGVKSVANIEAIKRFALKNNYISRVELAALLGFNLPEEAGNCDE